MELPGSTRALQGRVQPLRNDREVPEHPGAPSFLALAQDGAIKAREKQGSPGVGWLVPTPGQRSDLASLPT